MQPLDIDEPTVVGPYRLLGRLGSGGMGRVYLGRSSGGRTVAVKIVHPHFALDEEFRARFRREVEAARRVGGAWTAPVLDADPEARVPWVATAYAAGPSLTAAVAHGGALPGRTVRALGAGLGEALAAVHDLGLVHRDVKPSNILLTLDGPLLIDFGIARATDGTASLTSTGVSIGSPGYMAPEQILGKGVTGAADIFSLGAVLAYAATGEPPFPGDSSAALLYKVVHEEPELEALEGGIRELAAACLAKDPAARPTPREVARRLAPEGAARLVAGGWLPGALVEQVSRSAVQLLNLDATGAGAGPESGPVGFSRVAVTEGGAGSLAGTGAGAGAAGADGAVPDGAVPDGAVPDGAVACREAGVAGEAGNAGGPGNPGNFGSAGSSGDPRNSGDTGSVGGSGTSKASGTSGTSGASGESVGTGKPGEPVGVGYAAAGAFGPPPVMPVPQPPPVPLEAAPAVPGPGRPRDGRPHEPTQLPYRPTEPRPGKLSVSVAATAAPGGNGRGRRLSCTVALAVAGALAAVTIGGAFVFDLVPGGRRDSADGGPGATTHAPSPGSSATASDPAMGGGGEAVPDAYVGTWEGQAAARDGKLPMGTFRLTVKDAEVGEKLGTLRHIDLLGGTCDDVLTLKQVTGKQIVASAVGAEDNRGVCEQALHTVRLTPVGDDLRYESDSKGSGQPKARLSKIK
ncbi:protein kinase domain-containing protein [Streptomyces sp. HMX87]|uniref:serine/threonine-protein kinase n=1 Tax=Streptomyces sp. HMX87 TaxID=3390849 RepID=UPI003A8C68EF